MVLTHNTVIPVILFVFQNICADLRTDPLVKTKLGWVRGVRATDGDYNMFMGIPYAKVDKDNPFGTAIPSTRYDGILEANNDSAICPQIEEFNKTLVGSLDCLHINIYVPLSASSTNRLPVMTIIYGGEFSIGFAGRFLYGPKFFMRQDIILVTLNYRLGPYGFMCLDIPEVPGNQGLKDQQMALKWIQANIEAFGGDPAKVTISGHSSGGVSVDLHLLNKSNQTKLFDKVILQSGTARTLTPNERNISAPIYLSKHFGFPTNDIHEALSFLATVDVKLVIAAVDQLGMGSSFRPCVEKEFDNIERFISENWITSDVPKAKDMPILIGFTDDELLLLYIRGFHDTNLINRTLNAMFDDQNKELNAMEDIVKQFYFGDKELNDDVKFIANNYVADIAFLHPIIRTVDRLKENDVGNVYFYVFSYIGKRNFVKQKFKIPFGGAVHADELGYLFDISYMDDVPTYEDQLTVDRITTMWANFVKYGDPTPNYSELLPVKWMPNINSSTLYYLNIGSELSTGNRPFRERMSFWDLLYRTYRNMQSP